MKSVTIPMARKLPSWTTIRTSSTWVIAMIDLMICLGCLYTAAFILVGLLVYWLVTPTGEYVNDAPYRHLLWIIENRIHRGKHARRWTHPTIWWAIYPRQKHML